MSRVLDKRTDLAVHANLHENSIGRDATNVEVDIGRQRRINTARNTVKYPAPTGATAITLKNTADQRAKERLGANGVNLLNCSGEAAWQTVFHFHLHVILRFQDDTGRHRIGSPRNTVPSTSDEIEQIGKLLS